MDPVVAKEVAEKEFERLCALRRIDLDETGMTPKEVKDLGKLRAQVVKAISAGTLVVDEKGIATYTPPVPSAKPLTFRLGKGSTFIAMDAGKEKGEQHQMAEMLADLTGWSPRDLAQLDSPDYAFCTKLVGLFLA